MESALAEEFLRAYLEAREAFGVPITFAPERTVQAVIEAPRESRDMIPGGFPEEGDATARVLVEDLDPLPALGDRAEYRGRPYVVAHIRARIAHPVAEIGLRPFRR